MKYIDCFIPWQSDEQVKGTLDCLEAEPQVQSVNFLREEGPGNTKTIRFIAETATAPYTLLYNKYDTLQLGYHALTRLLTIAEDSQALMMYSDHYQVKSEELKVKNKSNNLEDKSNSDSSLFTFHSSLEPLRLIDYQLGSVRDDF